MTLIVSTKDDSGIPEDTKQIIVVRKLYPDGQGGLRKIRAGKLASQAAHASIMWLADRVCQSAEPPLERVVGRMSAHADVKYTNSFPGIGFTTEEREWLTGKFTKIVLGVDTEEQLISLYQQAVDAGLTVHKVVDVGLTEFDGEPTQTAIAIGPHSARRIAPITQGLDLL